MITTYGVLLWLPDLNEWAQVVARCLRPGGVLFLAEFHPFQALLDADLRVASSYFRTAPAERQVDSSYTGQQTESHHQTTWPWTVGGLVTALAQAGLTITDLSEHPLDLRQRHPAMTRHPDGFWHLPGDPVPLLLTCTATKPRRQ